MQKPKLIARLAQRKMSPSLGVEQDWLKEWWLEQDPPDGRGNSYGIRMKFWKDGKQVDEYLMELGNDEGEIIKKFNGGSDYKEAEKFGLAKRVADIEQEHKRKEKAEQDKQEAEDVEAEKRYNQKLAELGTMKNVKKAQIPIAQWEGWNKKQGDTAYTQPKTLKMVAGFDVGNGIGVSIQADSNGKHKTYTVTHMGTGLAMGHAWDKSKNAIALAKAEAEIADWSKWKDEHDIPRSVMDRASALVRGFAQHKLEPPVVTHSVTGISISENAAIHAYYDDHPKKDKLRVKKSRKHTHTPSTLGRMR